MFSHSIQIGGEGGLWGPILSPFLNLRYKSNLKLCIKREKEKTTPPPFFFTSGGGGGLMLNKQNTGLRRNISVSLTRHLNLKLTDHGIIRNMKNKLRSRIKFFRSKSLIFFYFILKGMCTEKSKFEF